MVYLGFLISLIIAQVFGGGKVVKGTPGRCAVCRWGFVGWLLGCRESAKSVSKSPNSLQLKRELLNSADFHQPESAPPAEPVTDRTHTSG